MAVIKFIFLLFFIAIRSVTLSSSTIIGQGIDMRKHNVMGEVVESGSQIFANIPSNCVNEQRLYQTRYEFGYYQDTKNFYRKTGTSAGISAGLQSDYTLGFTLDSSSNSVSGSNRTVQGNSLQIMATSSADILIQSCLYNQPLDKILLNNLDQLPITIEEPWKSSSWEAYSVFFNKFGSHVVSSIVYGSSITQMSFAKSSYSYSQNDFEVKSCLSLMGPTEAGMANISLCAGVTEEEINEVSEYSMSNNIVINGGTAETRNQLLNYRTAELITRFMNEAKVTRAPIYYKYSPIWELIQGHGNSSNYKFIKAVNMEQYYYGYLNYGCNLMQTSSGLILQKFDVSSQSSPGTPRYECTLEAEGCHSHASCAYRLVKCKCEGHDCVRYEDVTQDTGLIKEVPYINNKDKWYWHGCDWKVKGSKCHCGGENKVRFVAWSGDNKADLSSDQRNSAMGETAKEEL